MTNEELAIRIASGEDALVSELWDNVEKFINWRASRFYFAYESRCKSFMVEIDDLYQVGYFAMLKGVEKYDPARGTKFLTLLDFCLKTQFFALTKMNYKGWQNNTSYSCESLDALIPSAEDISFVDAVSYEDRELTKIDEQAYWDAVTPAIAQALTTLTDCQLKIVRSLYYDGNTHSATARKYGISKGAVGTISRASLRKLRNAPELQVAQVC
jgi:RNA polymerase sigma factor (sigma-70 family)